MFKKKAYDQNQLWKSMMTVLPAVMLMLISRGLGVDDNLRIIYAIVFCGVGALIGFGIYRLVRDKSRLVKTLTLIAMIAAFSLFVA